MDRFKKTGMLLASILLLITALYGYAHAKAIVIVRSNGYLIITIGVKASKPESINYEYDALGRLVEVETSNNANQSYDYDDAGNRTVIRIF